VAGSSECGYEPSGSIEGGEFPEQLNDSQLLKKDSASWNYLYTKVYPKVSGLSR
jgi:hypothetical protein